MHVHRERGAVVTQNCISARRTRRPGEPVASRPLEIVQIRLAIPRSMSSWLTSKAGIPSGGRGITLANIDVATRMVTGFYLSLEPPSRASIGLCLLHAVYETRLPGLQNAVSKYRTWPVAGAA